MVTGHARSYAAASAAARDRPARWRARHPEAHLPAL